MADDGSAPRNKLLHDLRTPLNQIIGYSEMLEEEARDAGQDGFIESLQKIQNAGRRLNALLGEAFGRPAAAAAAQPAAAVPATPSDAAPAAEPEPESRPPATEEGLRAKGGHLLVVDDNELNRDMLSRRLKSRGYQVTVAVGGRQALGMIEREPFDLVLLDVMMPEVSGLDVLRIVRPEFSRADLPIIMATAKDQSEDIVEALKLGANDYVTKPIDMPVALARIEAQLSLKRAMEEIRRLARDLEKRNLFIQKTFGRYLSDEVVDNLLVSTDALKLGGEKRVITILMSDLRGFTAVADRLAPEEVVSILNGYLSDMVEVITKHRGTIDEFIGDAILVLFGAPVPRADDARRAVACAIEMQLAMDKVNERQRKNGLPEVEMGIAVSTGPVVVGNIGSEKRAKYGVVGSQINLTSRIESFTVGGQILISDSTREAAGKDLELGRQIEVQAKGFHDPIRLHDLRGIGGDYGLRLAESVAAFVRLAQELPVQYSVVEGKHTGGLFLPGFLRALSANGAEMRCDAPPPVLTNLALRVRDAAGADIPGDLYAKVTDAPDGVVTLRFTSVPPAIGERLGRVMAGDGAV